MDTLTRDVSRDRRVLGLPRDLVHLVDVDDSAFALGHVEIGGLEQPNQDVLNVFADVTRFGERGRVGDGERNMEDPRQRLCEQRLTDPGGPDQENVGFVDFDVVEHSLIVDPLVVVVDRNGERPFRALLPDDVLIQGFVDFLWCRTLDCGL